MSAVPFKEFLLFLHFECKFRFLVMIMKMLSNKFHLSIFCNKNLSCIYICSHLVNTIISHVIEIYCRNFRKCIFISCGYMCNFFVGLEQFQRFKKYRLLVKLIAFLVTKDNVEICIYIFSTIITISKALIYFQKCSLFIECL